MKKNLCQVVAEQIARDPQFRKDAEQIKTVDALMAFAGEHGVPLTKKEAEVFLPKFEGIIREDKTLTDEELDKVSGGVLVMNSDC